MTVYGLSGGDVLVQKVTDPDAAGGFVYAPSTDTFDVLTTRTGSTLVTGLQDLAGGAISVVAPDTNGRIVFQTTGGEKSNLWLRSVTTPSATRWLVEPADLADRLTTAETSIAGLSTAYIKPGTGIPASDLDSATQTILTNSIPKSTVDAVGDLLVGSADNTVARKARGAALQVLRVNGAGTDLEYATPATVPTTLDTLTDVSATAPADATILQFDTTDGLWHAVDAAGQFATVGGDGRLASVDWPQGFIPTVVINPGGALPSYIGPGHIVGVRSVAAAALVVDSVGTGNNAATSSTSVTATNSLTFSTGEYAVICVSMSAETPATLPTVSATGPTNIGAMTAGPNIPQGSTVASYIFYQRATGAVATGQTFTVTATGGTPTTRSDWAIRVLRIQGLVSTGALDQPGTGGGASQAAFSFATSSPTTQANEVAIACFGYNPVTAGTFTPTGGWTQIGTPVANTDAGPRAVAVVYRLLTASGIQTATATVTNPTVWSGAMATFKAV